MYSRAYKRAVLIFPLGRIDQLSRRKQTDFPSWSCKMLLPFVCLRGKAFKFFLDGIQISHGVSRFQTVRFAIVMSCDSRPKGKICDTRGSPKICDDLTVGLFYGTTERSCICLTRCQVKLETLVIQFIDIYCNICRSGSQKQVV